MPGRPSTPGPPITLFIEPSFARRPRTTLISVLRNGFRERIDQRIRSVFGGRVTGFQVLTKEFPHYRFVDLYNGVIEASQNRSGRVVIQSQHPQEDLNSILNSKCPDWVSRQIKNSPYRSWAVDYDRECSLPVDCFWVHRASAPGARDHLVYRLRFDAYRDKATIEVACTTAAVAEEQLNSIVHRSVEASIYRNKVLSLVYETGTKDEYGDVETPSQLRVLFKALDAVGDDDIIISEQIREILQRNIIDLHLKRDILKAHRVPVRRGVLLYGPPGTGKTFACRWLSGKLPATTRIIVTGTALLQVNSLFSLARMLQPALVILEDVDLVFSSREVNFYSSVLGDLLDQMDGLRAHEDVGFVLTTNAIERMEAAIKDRPGRISQCVHFGAPEPELRRRYLLHYLQHYRYERLDQNRLVNDSQGATQAFLKEWVHRSVQIALERLEPEPTEIELLNEDFRRAMNEMRKFSEGETGRIIGFHG